jgi:hypothetical protein
VTLIVEMCAGGSGWRQAGTLNPGDRDGSLSDNRNGHRGLIVFRCEPGRSVIFLSAAGVDFEFGDERIIATDGLEELAALGPGESFERDVTMDRGLSCRVRWTHSGHAERIRS